MSRFRFGHVADDDWQAACLGLTRQIDAQREDTRFDDRADIGLLYLTPSLSDHSALMIARLREQTGVDTWVGATGDAILADGVEYAGRGAAAAMLLDLPEDSFRIFAGRDRLPAAEARNRFGEMQAGTALVHADPRTPELADLVGELSRRTHSGYLFGGVASDQGVAHFGQAPLSGGLSGVAFSPRVELLSRVTQGCAPLAREHEVTGCDRHYLQRLDGRPALDVLLGDLNVTGDASSSRDGDEILRALPAGRLRHGLFAGFHPAGADRGIGFGDYQVRHVVGIDPDSRVIAVAGAPRIGDRIVFCTRDRQAARRDLIRICSELREEIESRKLTVRGGVYVSCIGRGAALFGDEGDEMRIIRHNLGEQSLVGFYANGEIARDRIYGYTGVLTLFV